MRNSPLLGIGAAWLIMIIALRGQLGIVSIVLDYVYILSVAVFAAYLSRLEIIMLLGGYLGFMYYVYFFVSLPSMIAMQDAQMSASPYLTPQNIIFVDYVFVPLVMLGLIALAYRANMRVIKRFKIRERIGKVII